MAAVSMETTELETLFEAALRNPDVGMQVLNAFRVKNSKTAHPDNFGPGQLNVVHDAAWRAALTGLQADLDA
ncbi:hypothetical protein [Streptomyces europaeiscabiei]|uniref:hypothetical protein n=1 Tax=Streptomyces europaeiscabiei TaxID=146819 RepID=UPI0029AC3F57|nr:hypothetical protein [Streptomyces europaeiscabiei]MDX3666967.1 hypothetical protein [Streptomyces europaeiscabiei]